MRAPDSQSTDTSAPERPEFRRAHLATIFLQAAYPLTTSEVVAQVYNNPTNLELGRKPLSLDSARRALKRDIDALKACGLIIVSAGKTDDALEKLDTASQGRFSPLNYLSKSQIEQEIARLRG